MVREAGERGGREDRGRQNAIRSRAEHMLCGSRSPAKIAHWTRVFNIFVFTRSQHVKNSRQTFWRGEGSLSSLLSNTLTPPHPQLSSQYGRSSALFTYWGSVMSSCDDAADVESLFQERDRLQTLNIHLQSNRSDPRWFRSRGSWRASKTLVRLPSVPAVTFTA